MLPTPFSVRDILELEAPGDPRAAQDEPRPRKSPLAPSSEAAAEPGQPREAPGQRRRPRVPFSQLLGLERRLQRQKSRSGPERERRALLLQLSPAQVKICGSGGSGARRRRCPRCPRARCRCPWDGEPCPGRSRPFPAPRGAPGPFSCSSCPGGSAWCGFPAVPPGATPGGAQRQRQRPAVPAGSGSGSRG